MTSRQSESSSLRFGSVDFATEELSTSEASSVKAAAIEHGRGKITSVFVEKAASAGRPMVR